MKDSRHIIWTDYLDYDDWKEDLEAQYPELSANERMNLMYEINGTYFQDEKTNLDIQLSRPILVVGDLGLWHGRRMGYKEIESGNISDCLYTERDIDNATWFVDKNGDFRCEAIHHDGTNHYLPRLQGRRFRNANRQSERKDIPRYGDPCGHYKNNPQARRRDCQSTRVSDPPSKACR